MTRPLLLHADSGSTKTDWLLTTANNTPVARLQTAGINPFMQSSAEIASTLRTAHEQLADSRGVTEIRFYGAGCRDAQCERMRELLQQEWTEAQTIEVGSDLLGAAKALYDEVVVAESGDLIHPSGIACILGTGSNSGLFMNGEIVQNVSPLGYILGDEGSGAVLGRRLLGDVLKHQLPEAIERDFFQQYALTPEVILQKVYREPFANRFLASFTPFLHRHRTEPTIHALLVDEFTRFFTRNVAQYGCPHLPVSFVGSIAYFFQEELAEAAHTTGFQLGRIKRNPLD